MAPIDGFLLAALFWVGALVCDLVQRPRLARSFLVTGVILAAAATLLSLPDGTREGIVDRIGPWAVGWRADPAGLWLLLPGWLTAGFAVLWGSQSGKRGFASGAALALLGALGVLGLQNGPGFLIAWEIMGFGSATLILAEHSGRESGRATFFMLSLLETGAVALLLAILLLGPSWRFAAYGGEWARTGAGTGFVLALLWIVGCGSKLGLLPYYEWYPDAYASASGASGALLSGILLNVAYFALGRALLDWLGTPAWLPALGIVLLALAIVSAVLTGLYAFQQDDWRRLLAFSSAENASIAVAALGAALIFRGYGQDRLAALAWLVGLLQLMGHSLAKGALFFTADAAETLTGSSAIRPDGLLRRAPWTLGVGALCATLSLAALPPTAGFVSEWYLFQVLFHGFGVSGAGARIALALAGAGLALTAAIALATMVKLFGVGLLGLSRVDRDPEPNAPQLPRMLKVTILVTGLAVVVFAVSLVGFLPLMTRAADPVLAGKSMTLVDHWLLVPLSAGFAFISPALLVLVWPLLALVPLALLIRGLRQGRIRKTPLWCGGDEAAAHTGATTAFAFSNALRVFYSFVYRPRNDIRRTFGEQPYFLKELRFDYSHAPIFGPLLFQPMTAGVRTLAGWLRFLQNGRMNAYLAYIGLVFLFILALALVWSPHESGSHPIRSGPSERVSPGAPTRAVQGIRFPKRL